MTRHIAAAALLPILAACQPIVVEGPGDPYAPAGYRHLSAAPPPEALEALRRIDEELAPSVLRIREGCLAAFVDGQVIPLARGGQQICLGG